VDIVTHLAFGSALSALDREHRLGPGAGAALVVGSILPDIDASVAFARGMDLYLEQHQTGTHTVLAAAVQALMLAGALTVLVKGARFLPVAAAAFVAILGHFWWDLLSGSTMQLLSPFSRARLSWPLVAMAEPSIVLPLAVGVAVGWRRPHARFRAAVVSLSVLAVVVAVYSVARHRAMTHFQRFVASAHTATASWSGEPTWGSVDRWRMHARLGSQLGTWIVTAFSETSPTLVFTPNEPGDAAAVTASRDAPVVQRFLRFADFPFAEVEQDGKEHRVIWSDLKFCGPAQCDLRFGVALGDGRSPLYEIVWIRQLQMVRPAPK
jgi:membrane-bound metal-dependent hydrolase YbcI (DUF457 family)